MNKIKNKKSFKVNHPKQLTIIGFLTIFICMLLLLAYQADAQNTLTLKGRILDSATREPLPFATISIPESATGVISNEFGEFQYHIPAGYETSEVVIVFIGYDPIKVRVSDIQPDVLKTFIMRTKTQQLPEVEVRAIKGKYPASEIVFRAIRYIGKTHSNKEALLYGYYRDYVRPVQSNDYLNLLEAAVVINDKGFNTFDTKTRIKLEQLRHKPDVAIDSSLNFAYDGRNKFIPYARLSGANELSILRIHDPIRNHDIPTFSFVDVFDLNFVPHHTFSYEDISKIDSDTLYTIRFSKYEKFEKSNREYTVDGKIYIISGSYAILKFNYTITANTPTYSGKLLDLKMEYKDYNDKYYLNYLSMMNCFAMNNDITTDTLKPYLQYRELFINKVVNKPFTALKPHEMIDKTVSLLKNKVPVKEGFWDSYNYTGVTKLQE